MAPLRKALEDAIDVYGPWHITTVDAEWDWDTEDAVHKACDKVRNDMVAHREMDEKPPEPVNIDQWRDKIPQ